MAKQHLLFQEHILQSTFQEPKQSG